MRRRAFRPALIDSTLESRVALTTFTIVKPPASQINPKFLVLTERTRGTIAREIDNAFVQLGKRLADGADTASAIGQLRQRVSATSFRLPFGNRSANPVFQARIDALVVALGDPSASNQSDIAAARNAVRQDVRDYVSQGTAAGDFTVR